MTWPAAVAFCLRKKPVTELEARRHAAENGKEAFPCPYSQIEWHWHSGGASRSQANPKWWSKVDADARAEGGMGWPDGYAIGVIRARRAEIKAAKRVGSPVV